MLAGTKLTAPTYYLAAGGFYGDNCDFYGNLNNGDFALQGSGGVVHPGLLPGQVGTIRIHGNYRQEMVGTLAIELTAGGWSKLVVQPSAPGVGGNATLAGYVDVIRAANFTPQTVSADFVNADTVGLNGLEMSARTALDTWEAPAGTSRSFREIRLAGTSLFIDAW